MPPRKINKKNPKEALVNPSHKFTTVSDIKRSLSAQDEASLVHALTTLRNQLTVKHDEPSVSPADERILLAKAWLESSPGAQDVFVAWDNASARQPALLSLVVGVISAIITLLSSHYTYHSLAQPIIKMLLAPQYVHRLNSYLGGSYAELALVALKLYNALSNFAGGRERKSIFEVFAWDIKSLPKLFHMKRKNKSNIEVDILARPDIRTLFMTLLLSFVDSTTASIVKTAFLEQRREIFSLMFKGLWQDPYSLVRRVLEVCWTGIWADQKVRRTLKIGLFNETVLSQLARLYERDTSEDGNSEHVPADVVHHYLLAIGSRPGVGICFKDRGWYPRDVDEEDRTVEDATGETPVRRGGRIHNKILANLLKTLKVNEDPRQQELALKIMAACPELVAGYWTSAGLALEPRNSSKWIANVAFFGSVVSLPVPHSSFVLWESAAERTYQPVPPPLSTIIDNTIPSGNIKSHLSRGLQSASPLVQHCSALALAKCLVKYDAVQRAFEAVEKALEEDEEGPWRKRRAEVESEVRKRVPDFQVILGFSQKLGDPGSMQQTEPTMGVDAEEPVVGAGQPNHTKHALLSESAQRLLWLYHRSLPFLVAEGRFDVGKLLSSFQISVSLQDWHTTIPDSIAGLHTLRQLHVLRLLSESEQFNWSGKTGSAHSNFYILMKAFASSPNDQIRNSIALLLRRVLSQSLLFQHDNNEISLWLRSLPTTIRPIRARVPDGAVLTDESESVLKFLDDCVQRCLKTPYRYLDDLQALVEESFAAKGMAEEVQPVAGQSDRLPSPLLMSVLEQLDAKLKSKLLSPSDVLAIVTYIRKLISRLPGKVLALSILETYVKRLGKCIESSGLYPQHNDMTHAIRREFAHLRLGLKHLSHPQMTPVNMHSPAVEEFMSKVEEAPLPSVQRDRQTSAYELVDWFRLLDHPITTAQIHRLVLVIERFDRAASRELLQYLRPDQHPLWSCRDVPQLSSVLSEHLDFELLFEHCNNNTLVDAECRQMLVKNLQSAVEIVDIKRPILLIHHRLISCSDSLVRAGLLRLLAEVILEVQRRLLPADSSEMIRDMFRLTSIRKICTKTLTSIERQGLETLLHSTCHPATEECQQYVGEFSAFWSMSAKNSLNTMDDDQKATVMLWIQYMALDDLLAILDHYVDFASRGSSDADVLENVLKAIASLPRLTSEDIRSRLNGLLTLRDSVADRQSIDTLVARALQGCLPLYHGGIPDIHTRDRNLSTLLSEAQERWWRRHSFRGVNIDVRWFLVADTWSDNTVEVLTGLLYLDPSAVPEVISWMKTYPSVPCTSSQLAAVLYAIVDAARVGDIGEREDLEDLVPHFDRLVQCIIMGKSAQDSKQLRLCLYSICIAIQQLESLRPALASLLQKALSGLASDQLTSSLLYFVKFSTTMIPQDGAVPKDASLLIDTVIGKGMHWAVDWFSGSCEESQEANDLVDGLITLLALIPPVKSHLAEPVLSVLIEKQLSDSRAVRFMQVLIRATQLKPVTVNRYIQTIVQHPQLTSIPFDSGSDDLLWTRIMEVLHTLFHLYPINTCHPTHIEPLVPLYKGTLSLPDRMLISIFHLFEQTRKLSIGVLLGRWSSLFGMPSNSTLEALQSLEPNLVFKTCLLFPDWRRLELQANIDLGSPSEDATIYDPVFPILLLAQLLSEGPPQTASDWVQLFKTNLVSLLIRAASSRDDNLRVASIAQLAALYNCLQDADLQEQPQVIHILGLLRDALSQPHEGTPTRLPAYITLFLAHSVRAVFYPANFIYPITARFLLQRPELDTTDVPLLYGMLYSSSEQWKKERLWIVRFLSDGMVGSLEWTVLRRRHTWDLLASLFQGEQRDGNLRRGILEVLANITSNARATVSLLLKSSLLSWIELQIRSTREDEAIAWVRILENILTMVDPSKLEKATHGEWRAIFCRCIFTVVERTSSADDIFFESVNVTLRLSLLPGPTTAGMQRLITRLLVQLRHVENRLGLSFEEGFSAGRSSRPTVRRWVPHRAPSLFERPKVNDPLEEWGACIEGLWRATMDLNEKCGEWDELTSRLLIWRAFVGEEGSTTGEWVRKEVVSSVQMIR